MFKQQKAKTYGKDKIKDYSGLWRLSKKYDGHQIFIEKIGTEVKFFTSNHKQFDIAIIRRHLETLQGDFTLIGEYLYDCDGNSYIDYSNNFTSLIHGHCYPPIVDAVKEQLEKGAVLSSPAESQYTLAEIMCHCGQLRREYLHMLISYMCEDGEELYQDGNYLELPMLQRGLLWGIGRLCQCHRDEMIEQNIVENVAAYLSSTDSTVSGLALWSLGLLQAKSTAQRIAPFLDKDKVIQIYRDNFLQDVELGFLAEEALQAMS